MNFDAKAIVADEIPNMRTAVEDYTQSVEAEIQKIKDYEIETGDGIYGATQVQTVNDYIKRTCEEIGAIVRYFDEFQEALDQVGAAYESKQANIKVSEVATHQEADPEDLIKVNRME